MSKIILISGPTASGKSEFAVKIAKKVNGEIINADSMQIYKEIKILNTRPDKNLTKKVKHHLYGFVSVKTKFSVGKWVILANKLIKQIINKKKVPIIVGGTGLYFKSLTEGLVKIPNIPFKFRKKVRSLHKKLGSKKFFLRLIKLDDLARGHVNLSDTQRVIRAYEVKLYTRKSLYEWFKNTKSNYEKDDFFKIYIDYPRPELIKRINSRTEDMIQNGAILEVKKLIRLKVPSRKTAYKAIGIEEIREYLQEKIELTEVVEKISIKTRQYAKRQTTWGRGNMVDWNILKSHGLDQFLKKI